MNTDNLSIVIPVYNGAATIAGLVDRLMALPSPGPAQIVLVNDGSTDNSHEVCRQISQKYSDGVTYVNLSMNFGEHNAVMAGLSYASGDYAVIMDDDDQNPPEEALRLVRYAREHDHDVVYGVYRKKQHNLLRNWGSRFNNWVATMLLKKPSSLYLSSFKCLNRFLIGEVLKYRGPFPYLDGLILRSTRNIGVVSVEHRKREQGRSGYTLQKLIRLWLNMSTSFSINPLRLSSLFGFFFSLLGLVLSVFVIIEKILRPDTEVGWPSLVIAIMVFSGVQLVILGLLGEYVGRLFMSANQAPQFVVREVMNAPTS